MPHGPGTTDSPSPRAEPVSKARTVGAVAAASIAALAAAAYVKAVEPRIRRWGATDAEIEATLPVDPLVDPDVVRTTRAITICAPVERVWSWLVQIGQDRAGFYSYTWLENLVGAGMHNAGRLYPEWQHLRAGDTVWLAEEARFHERGRQIAARVDAPRVLALVSPVDWDRLERGELASGVWSFVLEPRDEHSTRLLVRSSGGSVGTHLFDALHFLMEQKMMRGLRDRAESRSA